MPPLASQVPDSGGPGEPRAVSGGDTHADHADSEQLCRLHRAVACLASDGAHGRAACHAPRLRECGGRVAALPGSARRAPAVGRDARIARRLGPRTLHRGRVP